MEVEASLGVEEWAFIQSVLESEASNNLQFDLDRSQQLAAENQFMKMVVNKPLTMERGQLKCVKPIDTETAAWIFKLEDENLQLHKMWKNQVTKRLDLEKKLERLDSARSKQLKESKRLRTICLQQAATLIDVYQKGCKQDRNSSTRVAEQVKEVETMEQWFMSGFKNDRKRSLETDNGEMALIKTPKRLKTSPKTETKDLIDESRARVMVEKSTNVQEDMKTSLIRSSDVDTLELENDVWPNLTEEFRLHDAQLDTDLMVAELTTNFDWHVERETPYWLSASG